MINSYSTARDIPPEAVVVELIVHIAPLVEEIVVTPTNVDTLGLGPVRWPRKMVLLLLLGPLRLRERVCGIDTVVIPEIHNVPDRAEERPHPMRACQVRDWSERR